MISNDLFIQVGDMGAITSECHGILLNDNATSRHIKLIVGTRFKVKSFDRDSESIIIEGDIQGVICRVNVSIEDISGKCILNSTNVNVPINNVYIAHSVRYILSDKLLRDILILSIAVANILAMIGLVICGRI